MLAVFDTETRGLWGTIFRMGYFDKVNGYSNFYNAEEFLEHICKVEEKLPEVEETRGKKIVVVKDTLYIYAFNLEFDLGKIIAEFKSKKLGIKVDFDKSLIINGRFHTAKIMDRNIVLQDLYPLAMSTLEEAGKSFELDIKKMEIPADERDNWFKNVSSDDERLLQYLESDVLATYSLLEKIVNLSGLPEKSFVRCPTIASLSMKIFRTRMPEEYETIKNSGLTKSTEEFVRKAYFGGRTEVFKNKAGSAYHYDVNSLYPFVMQKNFYPVGKANKTVMLGEQKNMSIKEPLTEKDIFGIKNWCEDNGFLYILDCLVDVPESQNIPVLPYRHEEKLLFPAGQIRGVWASPELEYAISRGCKIVKVYQICWWREKKKVFENFVGTFRSIKENSFGAKKVFAKYIQNSLYGKFGMRRERICYENWNEKKAEKLQERAEKLGRPEMGPAKICTSLRQDLLKYRKIFFADYIRPHFSVFVTSYARIELAKQLHRLEERGAEIYYCDTDSIVTNLEIDSIYRDQKEYGKWALERKISEGIFILPKLYAELEENGNEVLKSKGIVKEHMKSVIFRDYEKFYEYMVKGQTYTVYDENSEKQYFGRRKIITALIQEKDLDEKVLLKKRYLFSRMYLHKRIFDFEKNSSRPIIIREDGFDD